MLLPTFNKMNNTGYWHVAIYIYIYIYIYMPLSLSLSLSLSFRPPPPVYANSKGSAAEA